MMIHGLVRRASRLRSRRGIAAVLFGVLLPVFLGLTTLAIDVSVIAAARGQLNTAADAASLAGAMKLADEYRVRGVTDVSTHITAANAAAADRGQSNTVLNQAAVVVQDTDNSGDGDVRVGYINPSVPNAPFLTGSAYATLYNSVQLTMRRNSSHVAPVPTFFGKLMGFNGTDVTVTATATAQAYQISGFTLTNSSLNVNFLPIVLYVDNYNAMMASTTHDEYAYNPTTKEVTAGSDGIHESLIYPVDNSSPGNWGTINVGVTNNSTSTLSAQIRYGITPAQMATFDNNTIALDTTLTPPSLTFSGNPGISAGIKDDLTSIIGKPVIIPIYDQNGGNGNNAWYRVIKFQPVRIVDVSFQGNPKYVIVQPCLINEPSAIADPSAPRSWTEGGLVRLHLTR